MTFRCKYVKNKVDLYPLGKTSLVKHGILLQLRGNQKDFNFQLHHRLSKFEVPGVVNLKHIFELFGLYATCFLIQKLLELIRLSSDGQFWRKSQNKKGGKFELRSQLCYYNCIFFSRFRPALFCVVLFNPQDQEFDVADFLRIHQCQLHQETMTLPAYGTLAQGWPKIIFSHF